MRTKENIGLDAAVMMIRASRPSPIQDPRQNRDYIKLCQLFVMAKASYDKTVMAEHHAAMSRFEADKLYRELQVRKEIMEQDLGIVPARVSLRLKELRDECRCRSGDCAACEEASSLKANASDVNWVADYFGDPDDAA